MPLTRYARTRLDDDLHAQLTEDAAQRRLTVSKLIRALVEHHYRGRALPKLPATGPSYAVARELNRIGVNLNQIVHLANATNRIDLGAVDALRRKLITILETL